MLESQVGEARISNDTSVCALVQGLSVGQDYVGDISEQGTSLESRLREWVSLTYRLQPFAQCYPF